MALYHFHVDQVKRSEGRSAVASAAYRAGEKLHNLWDGETHDYTKKGGVVFTEIMLPPNAPERFSDRSTLWNDLEQFEKRGDAQLAYSFDIAMQNEFTLEENIEYARQFVREQFLSAGMIVDFAFHLPGKDENNIPNPHFHVLAPIRPLNEDGTWGAKQHRVYNLDENGQRIKKENGQWDFIAMPTTEWGRPETLQKWREEWSKFINSKFEEKGLDCRIDHRSYVDQGLDLLPTVHEGPQVRKMEKRGIRTEKGDLNRWIKKFNQMYRSLQSTIAALKEWIKEAKEILKEPEEVYLVDLLRDCQDMRNQVASTYQRGKKRAKISNMKRFNEECNYLLRRNISTLSEFENYILSLNDQIGSSVSSMNEKKEKIKELQQLIEQAKVYKELKPIAEELKKEQYRFKKAKVKYQEEHETELRRYYMVKRKLKEAGFEKEPFPLKAWEKELQQLEAQYSEEYEAYKPMNQSLAFSLGDQKGFRWIGAYDITAEDLLSGGEGSKTELKQEQAVKLIYEMLAGGKEISIAEINKEAIERGISERTVRLARNQIKNELGSERRGKDWWIWLKGQKSETAENL